MRSTLEQRHMKSAHNVYILIVEQVEALSANSHYQLSTTSIATEYNTATVLTQWNTKAEVFSFLNNYVKNERK